MLVLNKIGISVAPQRIHCSTVQQGWDFAVSKWWILSSSTDHVTATVTEEESKRIIFWEDNNFVSYLFQNWFDIYKFSPDINPLLSGFHIKGKCNWSKLGWDKSSLPLYRGGHYKVVAIHGGSALRKMLTQKIFLWTSQFKISSQSLTFWNPQKVFFKNSCASFNLI